MSDQQNEYTLEDILAEYSPTYWDTVDPPPEPSTQSVAPPTQTAKEVPIPTPPDPLPDNIITFPTMPTPEPIPEPPKKPIPERVAEWINPALKQT
ncbi:MAG: hypothetical protein RR053_01630, partial [Evtepia sp.]